MTATNATAAAEALTGWHRIFEPLHDEHDYMVDEVEGRIPDDLSGTMYRNGPGKWEHGGAPLAHLLEGDGMISAFRVAGGAVRFRNRYVRTPAYEAGVGSGGPKLRTAGTLLPGGPEANIGQPVAQQANTNVQLHAGQLLALYGSALPWALDPDTLDTVGQTDFGGLLTERGFSAHHKIDPVTGALINFSNVGGASPQITIYEIGVDGRGAVVARADVPFADWVHDFVITERNFVFALCPFRYDIERLMAGTASPVEALGFDADAGSVFVVVPKDGSPVRLVEHPAFAFFHFTNAHDEGDDVVVDLVQFEHDWDVVNAAMFAYRTGGPDYFANVVYRYRITGQRATGEPAADFRSDWPQLDWRRTGRPNRFSYHAVHDAATAGGGLGKVDHASGRATVHELQAGNIVGEPSFVPRRADADEDDGWVLFTAYDPTEHRTRLVVLDAQRVDAEPVATAHLRHHVPLTFHGSFAR